MCTCVRARLWPTSSRGNMSCPDLKEHCCDKVTKALISNYGLGCHPNTVPLRRRASRRMKFRAHTWEARQSTSKIVSSGSPRVQCNCIFTPSKSHDGLGHARNINDSLLHLLLPTSRAARKVRDAIERTQVFFEFGTPWFVRQDVLYYCPDSAGTELANPILGKWKKFYCKTNVQNKKKRLFIMNRWSESYYKTYIWVSV